MIRRPDMHDEWLHAAYDDWGDSVLCDICSNEMRWDPKDGSYYCTRCGQVMDRQDYFDYIGAEPPGAACALDCKENYPMCKRQCERYWIDPEDPILI